MKVSEYAANLLSANPALAGNLSELGAQMSSRFGRPFSNQRLKDILWEMRKPGNGSSFPGRSNGLNGTSVNGTSSAHAENVTPETDEERNTRIRKRFAMQEKLVDRVINGTVRSLVVSGPPGVGKSFNVEKALEPLLQARDELHDMANETEVAIPPRRGVRVLSGTVSVPGLIIAAWDTHQKGDVLVFDDCDDLFRDETGLNILKGILDTSQKRWVKYNKNATWMDDMGIPREFEYSGSVIFLSNIDFDLEIQRGSRLAPHLLAFIDRSLFLNLTLRTQDDFLARLDHLAAVMIKNDEEREAVMSFIREHAGRFHSLSGRLILHAYTAMKRYPNDWEDEILLTKGRV